MEKIKTYRIGISRTFPEKHPRAGEETSFSGKIQCGLCNSNCEFCSRVHPAYRNKKLHTIRANYPLWKKRIDDVNAGKAVLVLFEWTGKPYRSKQRELFRFDKDSGIGVQKLLNSGGVWLLGKPDSDKWNKVIGINELSRNDGLSEQDFRDWFKDYDLSEPFAIIHFTKFRY